MFCLATFCNAQNALIELVLAKHTLGEGVFTHAK